jgi:hypothetical protein
MLGENVPAGRANQSLWDFDLSFRETAGRWRKSAKGWAKNEVHQIVTSRYWRFGEVERHIGKLTDLAPARLDKVNWF